MKARQQGAAFLGAIVVGGAAAGCGGGHANASSSGGETGGSSSSASSSTSTTGSTGSGGAGGAGGTGTGGTGGAGSACGVPFSATGAWCYKLPAVTPVASNSAAVVATIQSDIKNNYGTWGINTDTYSSPIFTVPAGAPMQTWQFFDCDNQGSVDPGFAAVLAGVPTTPDLLTSMGTDAEITIYSPTLDAEWEFWQAKKGTGGQWSACWGGKIAGVSHNLGAFPPPYGATASGLPLLGFLVRIDELQNGLIEHALNIETVSTQKGSFSFPANRTDGNTAGADVPMEGQRFRLDPTFDVSTLPNAAERTMAKAMQDYGFILTDTSGAVVTQAEDPRPWMTAHNTTTNPYDALFGAPSYMVLQDIPLSRIQALPVDYGKTFMH
jgi:hypothetical protein